MLRRLPAPALLVALAVALSGCFQMHLLLRLNDDGSGTIEETILFGTMLTSFMQNADSTGTFSLLDEERLAARADSFGTGVRFVRADSVAGDGLQGFRVVYAFDDVNYIRLTDDMQALNGGNSEEGGPKGLDLITTFTYRPGRLRIHSPHQEDPAEPTPIDPDRLAARTDSIRQSMQESGALLQGFLGTARFSRTIALPRPITETDARFTTDSTITLAHLDFGAYLDLMAENPELAARLDLAQTDAERRAALSLIEGQEGIRFDLAEVINVRF